MIEKFNKKSQESKMKASIKSEILSVIMKCKFNRKLWIEFKMP